MTRQRTSLWTWSYEEGLKHHSEQWKHDPPSLSHLAHSCMLPNSSLWQSCPSHLLSGYLHQTSTTKPGRLRKWKTPRGLRAKGMSLVRLDYTDIKRFKSGTKQHKFDNRDGATRIWREGKVFRELHLTMDVKVKTMNHIRTSFINSQKFSCKSGHHQFKTMMHHL